MMLEKELAQGTIRSSVWPWVNTTEGLTETWVGLVYRLPVRLPNEVAQVEVR